MRIEHISKIISWSFLFIIPMISATARSAQLSKDELINLTAEELVHRYVRLDPIPDNPDDKRRVFVEEALKEKDPNDVFTAISQIIGKYDPRKFTGRWRNKSSDAYWAIALLSSMDENEIRARGTTGGRKAIESFEGLFERMNQAGYGNREAGSNNSMYRGLMSSLKQLNGDNTRDFLIARQLKEDYGIDMSPDVLIQFSDFLVKRDPRYVNWSKRGNIGNPPRHGFLDMSGYHQAYLDFQKKKPSQP